MLRRNVLFVQVLFVSWIISYVALNVSAETPPPQIGNSDSTSFVGINGGPCNQASILTAINAASSGDTIFIPSNNTYSQVLGTIQKDLTFIAATPDCSAADPIGIATIDGSGTNAVSGGLFVIGQNQRVSFININLRNASGTFAGIGSVFEDSTLLLDNVAISQGVASARGGGVSLAPRSTLHMNDSALFDNTGGDNGGGSIYAVQATLVLTDTDVGVPGPPRTGTTGDGGGIKLTDSTLTMTDGSIINNDADGDGGGLYAEDGSIVTLTNVGVGTSLGLFGRNNATNGAGIYASNSQITIADSFFSGNGAAETGGAIYGVNAATVQINALTTLRDNTARDGAAIAISGSGSSLTMPQGGFILENSASAHGGGIFMNDGATAHLENVNIEQNEVTSEVIISSPSGGGIYVEGGSAENPTMLTMLSNTQILTNSALAGGGINGTGDHVSITIQDSQLLDNSADFIGGAIRMDGGVVTMTDSLAAYNRSPLGGALAFLGTTGTLTNVELWRNSTIGSGGRGGGMYTSNGVQLTIDGPYFHQNFAGHGGAIYHDDGSLIMTSDTKQGRIIVNASTSGNGGGMAIVDNATATISASSEIDFVFERNEALNGGGIYLEGDAAQLELIGKVRIWGSKALQHGGGIYIDGGLLTTQASSNGNKPRIGGGNHANGGDGGGIYATNNASLGLYNFTLGVSNDFGNTATGNGGGLFAESSQIIMSNVIVSGNSAEGNGGGIALTNGSQATITTYEDASRGNVTSCDPQILPANTYCSELRNNRADGHGGAAFIEDSTVTMLATAILDNRANEANDTFSGSAIYATDNAVMNVNNGLVAENSGGTLIDLSNNSDFASEHSTYTANAGDAFFITQFTAVTLTNSIVWDNGGGINRTAFTSLSATCNIYQSSNVAIGGIGNVIDDPEFVVTARGNYRISADSPASDACANGLPFDLDYFMRPVNGIYDRGAFEVSLVPLSVTLTSSEAIPQTAYLLFVLCTFLTLLTRHLCGQKQRCDDNPPSNLTTSTRK